MDKRDEILIDIQHVFESPGVSLERSLPTWRPLYYRFCMAGFRRSYHIDFAWVCLGTFPASTGIFLWDDPSDRRIMAGEDNFEFRLREVGLNPITLKMQCNSEF
jgi:hypothetical protein